MKTTFSDGAIAIRPAGREDAEAHNEAVNESIAEVSKWNPWAHADYTIDESLDFLSGCSEHFAKRQNFTFSILDRESGRFLGVINLNHISRAHAYANMGYWVRTSATGRGVGTAATRLCALFGLQEIGLRRIRIQAAIENLASIRVAEKAGAVREGTKRKAHVVHGQVHDLALFSIIPGDPGYPDTAREFVLQDETATGSPRSAEDVVDASIDPMSVMEPLTDGVVTVRLVCPADADAIFAAAKSSVAEVSRFLPWCHEEYSIEETREWLAHSLASIARGTAYPMAIFDAASGRYLGGTGLGGLEHGALDEDDRNANLGYWIRTDAAGRGYATRATKLVARYGIENLGLDRIEIIASTENTPSLRVAEKAGAVREAILRNRLILHGRSHDVAMNSIIAEDLRR